MKQITKDQINATLVQHYNMEEICQREERIVPIWFVVVSLLLVIPGMIVGVFAFLRQFDLSNIQKVVIVGVVFVLYQVVTFIVFNKIAWKKKRIRLVEDLGYEIVT